MTHKLQTTLIFSLMLIIPFNSFSQAIPDDSLYLGQTPPGSTPKIFQLPVDPGCVSMERVAISPDGKQIYYNEYSSTQHRIKYLSYADNKWNGPFVLFENYWNPVLSFSGDTIYFLDGNNNNLNNNNPDAWYSVINEAGWGAPAIFWSHTCSKASFQKTNMGNYYFATIIDSIATYGVVSKLIISNGDTTIQNLGTPINSPINGAGFYIASDESYIIFPNNKNNFHTLVISYRKNDGGWTNYKSMGTSINISGDWYPWGPYVTADKKYMFYSNWHKTSASPVIHWVSLGNLIDSLKHTNFEPYLKIQIKDQTDTLGQSFNFTIPDSIFYDDDNDTLTYSATLNTGASLPGWLKFDTSTHTFSGTPLASRELPLYVKITAKDRAQASSSCQFALYVIDPPSSVEDNNLLPNELRIEQNYPNPFNPTTTIRYSLPKSSFVKLTIYNTLGQKIRTLKDSYQSAGEHSVVWDALDENNTQVTSGMYFYRLEAENITMQKKMAFIK